MNEAVDRVRRQEHKSGGTEGRPLRLDQESTESDALHLPRLSLKTCAPITSVTPLQDLGQQPIADAEPLLKRWYFSATHRRLEPTSSEHWDGGLPWFDTLISNGICEGITS